MICSTHGLTMTGGMCLLFLCSRFGNWNEQCNKKGRIAIDIEECQNSKLDQKMCFSIWFCIFFFSIEFYSGCSLFIHCSTVWYLVGRRPLIRSDTKQKGSISVSNSPNTRSPRHQQNGKVNNFLQTHRVSYGRLNLHPKFVRPFREVNSQRVQYTSYTHTTYTTVVSTVPCTLNIPLDGIP